MSKSIFTCPECKKHIEGERYYEEVGLVEEHAFCDCGWATSWSYGCNLLKPDGVFGQTCSECGVEAKCLLHNGDWYCDNCYSEEWSKTIERTIDRDLQGEILWECTQKSTQ